ncbi:hypothetical protein BH11BAC6_BH11BAC6_07250 [soil metagenome]
MRLIKTLISFSKYSDSFFVTLVTNVILAMTGNTYFTTPTPTLASLQTLLDDYVAAIAEAANKDRTKVALKNQSRALVNTAMRQLSTYINLICMGDLAKLTSTAMILSKFPEARIISIPENLRVTAGANPQSIVCKIKADRNADGYQFMITEDAITANSIWTSEACSRSTFTFTKLDSGKKYWVKVAVVGSNGQILYSMPVSYYAQ